MPKTAKLTQWEILADAFHNYPDVIDIRTMCEMLGGISEKTGYKLLRENRIFHFKIGKAFRVPKMNIISFLISQAEDFENKE
ncbi:MAG: helix-turn-helix domain-containing protein [Christensenellaceae bacterium]